MPHGGAALLAMSRPPVPPRDVEAITDISVEVYKLALGPRGVRSMLAADKDGGVKLRNRAKVKNTETARYLTVLGIPVPTLPNGHDPEPERNAISLFD
jgi:hypothetical protein